MRKLIFTLSAFALITQANAQNLRKQITGERGISQHFITLEQSQQVAFDPAKARSIFGLDANSELVLSNKEPDNLGMLHYRYTQTYKGIPVENSMYIAHTKGGKLTGMSGAIITEFGTAKVKPVFASLSGQQAIDAAIAFVGAKKYAWQDADFEQRIKNIKGATATYYPQANLVWFSGEDDVSVDDLTLAYKIDVYSLAPRDRKFVFIDAKSGKMLGVKQELKNIDAVGTAATGYSGTQTIHSDLVGSTYRLRDYTKGNGIITLKGATGHGDYSSASANWSFANADKWALDAHFGVSATWSFYKENFNRNSIDNAGFALTSWVNDPNVTDNASWDGQVMDFGNRSTDGSGVVGIDVTAHELTHGFTEYTSNLVYSREPGAMNESMSDIMGKSVQFWAKPDDINWEMSNDMNWIIRSFSNPNSQGQPDTYKGTYWENAEASFCLSILNDNCGVHTNSGVGNFMFYLLVTGGSGVNDINKAYNVTGIGLAKADQILYRTNTTYLVSTSKYADWRVACINAATDLYGANSNEVNQVKNAWYAVGIGEAGSTCTPTAPTGLLASALTSNSATLSWGAVSGAVSYTLEWKLASASTWTTVSGLTTTTYNLGGLAASSAYEFHVSSSCGGTTSAYSTTANFTTLAATGGCSDNYEDNNTLATAKPIPVNVPITGIISSNPDKDFFTITNTAATPNIQISLTNLPKNYDLRLYKANGVPLVTSQNIGTADESVTYNTTVVATYIVAVYAPNATSSPSCYTLQVNLSSGTPVTCNVPVPSASAIAQTTATISWPAVSGAVTYDLQYKTSAAGSFTTVSGIAGTSYNLSGLTAATVYNYQVKTNCSGGTSAYSTTASFTTLAAACNAPVPAASAIAQTTATISWPAVSGAASYDLQYKTAAAGSFTTVAGIVGTSYNLTGLTPATVYNYQVKTNCSGGTSAYSTTANFTTAAAGCSDIYEDNNTLATAKPIPVNVPVTGIISSNPDKDFFTITNTAATPNIKISLTNLPKNYDLRLYKANGVPLVTSQNAGLADESVTYNTTVVATYVVAVYANNATSSPNCYTLQANLSASPSVTDINSNSLIGFVAPTATSQDVTVYPQPAKGVANLRFSGNWKGATNVTISNQLGMKVGNVNLNVEGGYGKLDVTNLKSGMYYLRLSNGKYSVVQKLMVLK